MSKPFIAGERLFTFALVADSHITHEEAAAIGYDVDTVALSVSRFRYVVDHINRLAPDFVVHLGDITHPVPGSPVYEDSTQRFRDAHGRLRCPLYLVPGNHDIGEKAFAGELLTGQQAGLTVNEEMIEEYERHFQPQYYAFAHKGCLFIVINAMLVNSGLACEQQQRLWLETLLAESEERRIFIFSHYPLYLCDVGEVGHYDAIDEPGRSWLLDLLKLHDVEAFYAGHVHNFFFNRYGETHCYVLPSTCFLRHDYHELFRVAPDPTMRQGRHDGAKLGYAIVEVYQTGHLSHVVRTYGRTRDDDETPGVAPAAMLPRVHALKHGNRSVGIYLRQPWCDSADIPTPWGLDPFRRKRIRNDYPLMALWEMGVRELRVPLDDLADPATHARMAELSAVGHRFTAYCYGLPKGAARGALIKHGHQLAAWEVIAPVTRVSGLLAEIAALKGETPVIFNAYRGNAETFSGSHGFEAIERGAVEAVLSLDGAREVIDGIVVGIGSQEAPIEVVDTARSNLGGLDVRLIAHVQFAYRKPMPQEVTERRDANRIAEAVTAAMAFDDVTVVLDNFTGIDRGYYFSGGLVDRLYNPLSGSGIVRHLQAALGQGCRIDAVQDAGNGRIVSLQSVAGAAVLVLPEAHLDASELSVGPLPEDGLWLDLASGDMASGHIAGPTLIGPSAMVAPEA